MISDSALISAIATVESGVQTRGNEIEGEVHFKLELGDVHHSAGFVSSIPTPEVTSQISMRNIALPDLLVS